VPKYVLMRAADAERNSGSMPLGGIWVLTLAVNLPGPVAASRLCAMGASVVKIEPPGGDPLARMCPGYYEDLSAGQEVVRLDLKDQQDRASLDDWLEGTDLLLTANRPAALGRLGLSWTERAVSVALSLLFARERGQGAGYEQVALSEAARSFAGPLHQGLTTPEGVLGGGFPGYGLYHARDGHVALAALEPHFWKRLLQELGVEGESHQDLERIFETKSAEQWEEWATDHDLPLVVVRE
jgi:alpha-methylacyl-CoA racemase